MLGKKDGKWVWFDGDFGESDTKYYLEGKESDTKKQYLVGAEKTKEVIEKTSSVNKDDQPGATSGFFEGVTAVVKWLFTPTL